MIRICVATILSLAFLTSTAHAHPGHGTSPTSTDVWHYLTSPMHIGTLLLAGLILGSISRISYCVLRERRPVKKPVGSRR